MNNFHYHQDPMYAAAAAILAGKTQLQESDTLEEGVEDVKAIINTLKIDDLTNSASEIAPIPSDSKTKENDIKSCNALANICVLQMYDQNNSACRLYNYIKGLKKTIPDSPE